MDKKVCSLIDQACLIDQASSIIQSKTATLKKSKIGFQYQLSLDAGQKYCRMVQEEHSAIPSTFIKLLFVSLRVCFVYFEWPFYTGFTVI